MDTLLSYLLKSAICFSVLFVPFLLLLRRDRSFTASRWLLLAIMLLSIILPAIEYQLPQAPLQLPPRGEVVSCILPQKGSGEAVSYVLPVKAAYFIGFCLALLWHAKGLYSLYRVIRRDTIFDTYIDDGVTLRYLTTEGASFSWMNTIVMSQKDLEQNKEAILTHELAHIHLHHSYDKILMIALQTLQWFNPLVWLVNDVMNEIHEYEADARVVRSGIDKRQYQMLLISKITSPSMLVYANGLNMSNVKNRVVMLNKQSHRILSTMRQSLLLPALAMVVALLATYTASNKLPEALKELTISRPHTITEETFTAPPHHLPAKRLTRNSSKAAAPVEVDRDVAEDAPEENIATPTQEEQFVTMMHESVNASHTISRRNETDVIKSVIAEYINNKTLKNHQ